MNYYYQENKDANIPENIKNSEIYGIVNKLINERLSDQDKETINIATLTTLQTNEFLKTHIYSALNSGLTPVQISKR